MENSKDELLHMIVKKYMIYDSYIAYMIVKNYMIYDTYIAHMIVKKLQGVFRKMHVHR